MSLRGVLFTDTGPYRGAMRQCYHRLLLLRFTYCKGLTMMVMSRECDSKRRKFKGSFASYDFLAQTVQTVRRPIKSVKRSCTLNLIIFAHLCHLGKTIQSDQNQVIDTVSELSGASCPASARQQRMKRFAHASSGQIISV